LGMYFVSDTPSVHMTMGLEFSVESSSCSGKTHINHFIKNEAYLSICEVNYLLWTS
jgi:hypothetical protein